MGNDVSFEGRVVVGYDGSPSSTFAVSWAAAEAELRGRGLCIVHALMPTVSTGSLGAGLAPGPGMLDELVTQAHQQLDKVAAGLGSADVTTAVQVGGASGALLEASETAALIVLGSRGHGGFARLILGSVAAQVAAHAECPVVTIRQPVAADAREVVVGIDASPGAASALQFAFDEASRHGWSVVAVHAWDTPAYDLIIVPVALSDVADETVRMSAEILSGFRDDYPDVEVTEHLVHGPPVGALLEASANAAMIVVGTRGHGPAIGALIGSVSNGVLHRARVPVVVVPRPEPEPDAA